MPRPLTSIVAAVGRLVTDTITTAGDRLLRSRRLMRAPIWIYRARLGFLLGSRILLLEHIGRQTGKRRLVTLEVVDHPSADTYMVASGFGTASQWFRNIRAEPHVRVSVGHHVSAPAVARILDRTQASAVLATYEERHPRAWSAFKPVFESTLGDTIDLHETTLPMVALHLEPSSHRHERES